MSDYIERLDERRHRRAAAAAASVAAAQQQQQLLGRHYSDSHDLCAASPPSPFSTGPLPVSSDSLRAGAAVSPASAAGVAASKASRATAAVAAAPCGRAAATAGGDALCLPQQKKQQHLRGQQELLLQEVRRMEQQPRQERTKMQQHFSSVPEHLSQLSLQPPDEPQQLLQQHQLPVPQQQQQQRIDEMSAAAELRQQALLSEEKARCLPRGRQRELLLSFAAAKRQRAEELLQQTVHPACGAERQADASAAEVVGETTSTAESEATRLQGGGEEKWEGSPRGVVTAAAVARERSATATAGKDPNSATAQTAAPEAAAAASGDSGTVGSLRSSRANACSSVEGDVLPVAHDCSRSYSSSSRVTNFNRQGWENSFSGDISSRQRSREEAVTVAADSREDGARESRRLELVQQQVQLLREVAAQQRDKAVLVRGSKQRSLLLMAEKKEKEAEQLLHSLRAFQEREEKEGKDRMHSLTSNCSSNGRGVLQQPSAAVAAGAIRAEQQPNHLRAAAVSPPTLSPSTTPAAVDEQGQWLRTRQGDTGSRMQQAQGQWQEQQQGSALQPQQWQQEEDQRQREEVPGEVARLRMEAAVARDKASCCSGAKARQLRSLAELKDRLADERLRLLASPTHLQTAAASFDSGAAAGGAGSAFRGRGRGTAAEAAAPAAFPPPAAPTFACPAGVTSRRQDTALSAVEKCAGRAGATGGSHSSASVHAAAVSCYPVSAAAAIHPLPRLGTAPAAAETAEARGTGTVSDDKNMLLRRVVLLREEATSNRLKAACVCGGRQRQLLAIAAAKERQALEIEEKIGSSAVAHAAALAHPMGAAASRGAADTSAGSGPATAASDAAAAASSSSPSSLQQGLRSISGATATQRHSSLHADNQQQQHEEEDKLQQQRFLLQQQLVQQQQQRQLRQQQQLRHQEQQQGHIIDEQLGEKEMRLFLQEAKKIKQQEGEDDLPPPLQLTRLYTDSPPALPANLLQQLRQQQRQQQQYRQQGQQEPQQEQQRGVLKARMQDHQRTHAPGESCGVVTGRGCEAGDRGWNSSNNGDRSQEGGVAPVINSSSSRSNQREAWRDRRVGEFEGRKERETTSEAETLGQLQQRQLQLQRQLHLVEEQLMLQRQREAHTEQQARLSQLLQVQQAGGKQQQQEAQQAQPQHPLAQQQFTEGQLLQRQHFVGQALHQRQQERETSHRQQLQEDTQQHPFQHQRRGQQQEAEEQLQQDADEQLQQDEVQVKRQRQLHAESDARRFQGSTQPQQQQLKQQISMLENDQRHRSEPGSSNSGSNTWCRKSSSCNSFGTSVFPFFNSSGTQQAGTDEQTLSSNKPQHAATAAAGGSRKNTADSSWVGSRSSTATSVGLGSDF